MDYLAKTIRQGECIVWTGHKDRCGYGRTSYQGRKGITVHRAVWLQAGREIPPGLELDHICRNRACIKLEHLRAVTHRENTLNREASQYRYVCRQGHGPKVERRGKWVCYKCVAAAVARWREKQPTLHKPDHWYWRGKWRPCAPAS